MMSPFAQGQHRRISMNVAQSSSQSSACLIAVSRFPVRAKAMAYRVNGLPPFQVSFSITFPEGYVGKEKLDTKFQVEAEDTQTQVGVLSTLAKTAKYDLQSLDANALELHTRLEALQVIASTGVCNEEGKPNGKLRSRDCDETTEGSDDDLVTRSSSMKTAASSYSQEMWEFSVPEDDDVIPDVPICGGEVLATPLRRQCDAFESSRQRPFVASIAQWDEPGWD
ncbi:unnamed protein product [Effrenium voratum]|nr:unnamed protein product [Effrenium voratum]